MAGFYYTDGEYPKVTHAQIATGGSNKADGVVSTGHSSPRCSGRVGTITHLLVVWMMT